MNEETRLLVERYLEAKVAQDAAQAVYRATERAAFDTKNQWLFKNGQMTNAWNALEKHLSNYTGERDGKSTDTRTEGDEPAVESDAGGAG